jgi:outer membrane biosynthesis protein TonB
MEEKKYIRNFTEEARAKQKEHLSQIRQKAMEKKREMKEITLKAKLMKLEPKIELAKKYDEYISNRITQPPPTTIPEPEPEEIIEIEKPKPKPKPKKKIIYQEVEEEEEEEQIVYVKKNKPKPQESLNSTLYKSSQETLFNRAIEERIRANLTGFYSAMLPREY